MLVEIGAVFGPFDIGPVVRLLVEVVDADMSPLGPQPAAVILGFAHGGRLIHGLEALDSDPWIPLRRESGVFEHIIETVPDDDVSAAEPAGDEPVDKGVHDLEMGADRPRADRVDFDSDDIVLTEE